MTATEREAAIELRRALIMAQKALEKLLIADRDNRKTVNLNAS